MTTNETPGHHGKECREQHEYLTLAFSPLNAPLRSRWRNNGLSADFLGEYVVTFLPAHGSLAAKNRQREIRHAVTYIANELLENAMKFHARQVDIPIQLHLELTKNHIAVNASNGLDPEQARNYERIAQQIRHENASDQLFRQLERNAADKESKKSALGLLTMIHDYHTELSWAFEVPPEHPGMVTVTTRAVLPLNNAPEASA